MPKLKHLSASHRVSQAKRHKQKQREDPDKRLQEQEQSTIAHKEVRLDSIVKEEEQDRNTAAGREA